MTSSNGVEHEWLLADENPHAADTDTQAGRDTLEPDV
jgi:hypothetical protein